MGDASGPLIVESLFEYPENGRGDTMDTNDKNDTMDNFDNKKYNEDTEERGNPDMVTHQIARRKKSRSTDERNWITTGEAARLLGVGSVNTVKRWAREGKLKSRQLGVWVQIDRSSIDRLIEQQEIKEARILEARIERLEKNPQSAIPWRKVRRTNSEDE